MASQSAKSLSVPTRRSNAPALALFRLKDVTGALRARRYRRKKNGNEIKPDVTVEDLELAERLIMARATDHGAR
jgi:hypothetical protein